MSTSLHHLFAIERAPFRLYPPWLAKFLTEVQQTPPTARPPALLLSEEGNISDALVIVRLADLLALLQADE